MESYKRIVAALEEEVSALRNALAVHKRGEASRLKLELARQAEKHRRDIEAQRKTYDRESKLKQEAVISAMAAKYSSDLDKLRLSYQLKLSNVMSSKASTEHLSTFELNYFRSRTPGQSEEQTPIVQSRAHISNSPLQGGIGRTRPLDPSLLDDDPTQAVLGTENSDTLTRLLLGTEGGEEDLLSENKRLRELLASGYYSASEAMCVCCKKLASATHTLDYYLASHKDLLQ
jgi:hypothetical protein